MRLALLPWPNLTLSRPLCTQAHRQMFRSSASVGSMFAPHARPVASCCGEVENREEAERISNFGEQTIHAEGLAELSKT